MAPAAVKLRPAIRFLLGFSVGLVIAAVKNLLPYWETFGRGSQCGIEHIGYPETIWAYGGFLEEYQFYPEALTFNIAVGVAISIVSGIASLIFLPPVLRRWGHLFSLRKLSEWNSRNVFIWLAAASLGVSIFFLLCYLASYETLGYGGIFSSSRDDFQLTDNELDEVRRIVPWWDTRRTIYLVISAGALTVPFILHSWVMRTGELQWKRTVDSWKT